MNQQSTHQLIEAFAKGHSARLAEDVFLTDYAQERVYRGQAAVKELLDAFYQTGFSGAYAEVKCIMAEEGGGAITFIFHGTQTGRFMGLPATGRLVAIPMALICQLSEGQIRQAELYYDAGCLLRQLGFAI